MGTGIPANLLEMFVADQVRQGNRDASRIVGMLALPSKEEDTIDAVIRTRVPMLQAAGVI
jgi:hypothetical protein